jgi:hypothetical protein
MELEKTHLGVMVAKDTNQRFGEISVDSFKE